MPQYVFLVKNVLKHIKFLKKILVTMEHTLNFFQKNILKLPLNIHWNNYFGKKHIGQCVFFIENLKRKSSCRGKFCYEF